MNEVEYRARAAMREIAWTVRDAPPLRLPRRQAGATARRRRLWLWMAPLAAAAAVIGIAVALVTVRGSASRRPAPAVTPVPSAVPPRYYVALNQAAFDSPASLVVGDTLTGARVTTVPPPAGSTFSGVTGAADDRTFVVDSFTGGLGDESAPLQPRTWYLLRIAPGSAHPATLTRLRIPATPFVNAIALSPDGSRLAIAVQPGSADSSHSPVYLRVYSVASGALLLSRAASDGSALFGGPATSGPDRNDTLFWRSDGRALSFTSTWTAGIPKLEDGSSVPPTAAQARNIRRYTSVWVLDLAAQGNDLLADSRLAWEAVTYPDLRPSATPACVSGTSDLLVSPDGKVIVCAATDVSRDPGPRDSAGCRAARPWRDLDFLEYSATTRKRLTILDSYQTNCNAGLSAVDVLWVSQSGDAVIGYVNTGHAVKFGVFRQGRFTPLPAPLTGGDSTLLTMIAW